MTKEETQAIPGLKLTKEILERLYYDEHLRKEFWERNKATAKSLNVDCKRFCKELLEEIWGGPIPSAIDPVKNVKKILSTLSRKERNFWRGTELSTFSEPSLESRLSSAVNAWTKGHRKIDENHLEFCGFTIVQLKEHLESNFELGMSWENWGSFWEVDHIIPRRLYKNPFSKKQIFGLKNIRPLPTWENKKKHGKYHGSTKS